MYNPSHHNNEKYEDLAQVQKECGFVGTEGKCMVLKVDDKFVVYVTLQGKRLDFDRIEEFFQVKKVRLAAPGCAYPFGFDIQYDIYADPEIYQQEWFLFSPVFPTKTIQVKGEDLRKVFNNLENKVEEVTGFNI